MSDLWIVETSEGFVFTDNEERDYYLGGSGVFLVGFRHRKDAQRFSKMIKRYFNQSWNKTIKVKVLK